MLKRSPTLTPPSPPALAQTVPESYFTTWPRHGWAARIRMILSTASPNAASVALPIGVLKNAFGATDTPETLVDTPTLLAEILCRTLKAATTALVRVST